MLRPVLLLTAVLVASCEVGNGSPPGAVEDIPPDVGVALSAEGEAGGTAAGGSGASSAGADATPGAGAGLDADLAPCVQRSEAIRLPAEVRESSGVGYSVRFPGMFWSHNDSGWTPLLYILSAEGTLQGTLELQDVRNRDWEDLAVAPCDEGSCIWVADTGDNQETRTDIQLLRLPETRAGTHTPVTPDVFPIELPDGPRDIEAMYVLPGERVFLVTKGRDHPVVVYHYPLPLRPGERVMMEEVQVLFPDVPSFRNRITGAAASADGGVVLVRSYDALHFFRPDGDQLVPLDPPALNLRPLMEAQGEAVGIGPGGEVVLTSEGGPLRGAPTMVFLDCSGVEGLL